MELSAVLFAFGLFAVGIRLIFVISGVLKEDRRQEHRIASEARRSFYRTHYAPHATRRHGQQRNDE